MDKLLSSTLALAVPLQQHGGRRSFAMAQLHPAKGEQRVRPELVFMR